MIYLLEHSGKYGPKSSYPAGDAHTHAIVIANNEQEARELASLSRGDEGKLAWLRGAKIKIIDPNGMPELLGMF